MWRTKTALVPTARWSSGRQTISPKALAPNLDCNPTGSAHRDWRLLRRRHTARENGVTFEGREGRTHWAVRP